MVHETVDLQAGRTALSGAMWTGLLGLLVGGPVGWIAGIGIGAASGAITAKVVDLGVPDEWVDWFRDAVAPGTFTVVVLAEDVDVEALIAEAMRFEGQLVHANMAPDAIRRLEHALGDVTHDPAPLPGDNWARPPPTGGSTSSADSVTVAPALGRGRDVTKAQGSGGADLVGAVAVAGDHVLGALDDGVRQDGPDELELADAGLPVAPGDGRDRGVVLDDAVAVRPDRLGGRDVAVLVEDRGQLGDLGLQRPLRCQPMLGRWRSGCCGGGRRAGRRWWCPRRRGSRAVRW